MTMKLNTQRPATSDTKPGSKTPRVNARSSAATGGPSTRPRGGAAGSSSRPHSAAAAAATGTGTTPARTPTRKKQSTDSKPELATSVSRSSPVKKQTKPATAPPRSTLRNNTATSPLKQRDSTNNNKPASKLTPTKTKSPLSNGSRRSSVDVVDSKPRPNSAGVGVSPRGTPKKSSDTTTTANKKSQGTPESSKRSDQKTKKSGTQVGAHQPDLVSNSIGSRAHAAQEISRLEALCEARTKELNLTKMQLKDNIQGFDAMAIMVQYLTTEVDAFSVPKLTADLKQTQTTVAGLQSQLENLSTEKCELETSIQDLIEKHKESTETVQTEHLTQLQCLEERLVKKHSEELEKIVDQHSHEVNTLKSYHEKHLKTVESEQENYMKHLEQSHSERLSVQGQKHEQQLDELQKNHECKLNEITQRFEEIKFTLSDKVYTLKAECDELRNRAHYYEEALQRDTDYKVQLALAPYRSLPQEIESMKTILEMRNQEIHELRTKKLEMEEELKELPPSREKIIMLEQKIENLEAIINIKSDYEKQLSEKQQVLMRKLDRESKANKRLSMNNEELVYKLEATSPVPTPVPTPGDSRKLKSPTMVTVDTSEVVRRRSQTKSPPGSGEDNYRSSQVPIRRSISRTGDVNENRKSSTSKYDDESKYYQTL